jgi:hypothetical protein
MKTTAKGQWIKRLIQQPFDSCDIEEKWLFIK